ncbi:MAG TPA: carboxylating nicotinate-nucleotide diphosphorylase [Candidatus Binatia bacterium]|nr:carboxylating nicotinate-nucleotide diphosphorylase [Candidatus Binatia bacterium]
MSRATIAAMPLKGPKLPDDLADSVRRALAEDVGAGDVTARLVPKDAEVQAVIVAREAAVLCGCAWFEQVFAQLSDKVKVEWDAADGASVRAEQRLCVLRGPARPLLTGERTALNFLQTLSGTATLTRKFVERVRGTPVKIVDTRKTVPGLRAAQKYAVVCGGGDNHRFGLYDAILIKENHIAAAGSLTEAVERARALKAGVPLMLEAENLGEVQAGLDAKVDLLLLDDFPTHLLSKAVAMAREYRRFNKAQTVLEASGGVNLNNVRAIADTGVDRISVGGITKHVQAVDISMRFVDDVDAFEEAPRNKRSPK